MNDSNDINYNAAVQACKYARDHIKYGCTQLINNSFDADRRKALLSAVLDLRQFIDDQDEEINKFNSAYDYFRLMIENCKKYSLGNCYELAYMALDYVSSYCNNVYAEVYHIENGDHVFLVVGRDPKSDVNDPSTWGDDAYICDPWADKVYKAKDYLLETKNYFREKLQDDDYINKIEDFDKNKHVLSPNSILNTDYIKSRKNNEINSRLDMLNSAHYAIEIFKCELEKISDTLKVKFGEDSQQYKVIRSKIDDINNILKIKSTVDDENVDPAILYQKQLRATLQAYRNFDKNENASVLKSHGAKWYGFILEFIGILPPHAKAYVKAAQEADAAISEVSNLNRFGV